MNIIRPAAACFILTSSMGTMALGQNLKDRIDHVMQQRATAETRNSSKAAMIGKLLYTDITVKFSQTPLRDTINYLETVLNINLVGRYNDDRMGIGLDPNAPITLDVTGLPALTVLEMILAQSEIDEPATWQLRDGFVEVGTKERLSIASAREIRYYPIRDLLFEPPHFDNAPALDLDAALEQGNTGGGGSGGGGGGFGGGGSGGGGSGGGGSLFGEGGEDPVRPTEAEKAEQIIALITEIVEPDAWESNGGEAASIRFFSGTLIVRAPDFIHRQLAGYPFAVRPSASVAAGAPSRYVMFTGGVSNVEIAGIRVSEGFGGSAGGGSAGAAGSPGAPGTSSSGAAGGSGDKNAKSGDAAKKDASKPKTGADAGAKDAGKGPSGRSPKGPG